MVFPPNLIKEWSSNNDRPLTTYTRGSGTKGLWICPKGHEYPMSIKDRYHGRGCPYCANKRVLKGYNDLESLHPAFIDEWDYEKNAPLTPADVTRGYCSQVWWKCKNGHTWKRAVVDRYHEKHGCPYCSHHLPSKEYNLKTEFPDVAAEWDYERNKTKPEDYLPFSSVPVWWKCKKGHSWPRPISDRTRGHGCPYCAGVRVIPGENDVFTVTPELALEWDFERNDIDPKEVAAFSSTRVWWVCPNGHHYRAAVSSRSLGKGCLKCYKMRLSGAKPT